VKVGERFTGVSGSALLRSHAIYLLRAQAGLVAQRNRRSCAQRQIGACPDAHPASLDSGLNFAVRAALAAPASARPIDLENAWLHHDDQLYSDLIWRTR